MNTETQNLVLSMLEKLQKEMNELKELWGISNTTISEQEITEALQIETEVLDDSDPKEMTATEWLKSKGITFESQQRKQFSFLLSQAYRRTFNKEPKKAYKISKDGKKNNGVFVYHYTEFPILQLCLNKMLYEDNI